MEDKEVKKIKAFHKCIDVIRSCKTFAQLQSADNIVKNFGDLFKDGLYYGILLTISCKSWSQYLYNEDFKNKL